MPVVIERPSLASRFFYLLRGFDLPLLIAVALLALIGLVTMYSSGFANGERFWDQSRNLLIAAVVMLMVAQVPPQRLMNLAVPIYVVGVLLLLAVALFGITKKGATRWINLGVVIQPSELLKIGVPLMLAWWFQRREGQLRPLDFALATLILAIPVGLIIKQPDLGTALLVLSAGLYVIFFAGLSWRWRALGWCCWSGSSPNCVPMGCAGRCCTTTSSSGSAPCWTPPATPWARAFTFCRG